MASLDAARRQLAVHGEALLERTIARRRAGPRGDRRGPGLPASSGEGFVGRPGVAGWDPLRIVDRRPRHGLHRIRGRGGAAGVRTTSTSSSPRTRPSCSCSGLGQPIEPLERLAHDFAETVRRIARPGDARGDRAPAGAAVAPDRDPAARCVPRSRARRCRSTRRSADLVRGDRRLSAGRAGTAARRAGHRRGRRLSARADRRPGRGSTAPPTRRSRPFAC